MLQKEIAEITLKNVDSDRVFNYTSKNMSVAIKKVSMDVLFQSNGSHADDESECPCIHVSNESYPSLSAVGLTGKMKIGLDQFPRLLGNISCFHIIVSLISLKILPT